MMVYAVIAFAAVALVATVVAAFLAVDRASWRTKYDLQQPTIDAQRKWLDANADHLEKLEAEKARLLALVREHLPGDVAGDLLDGLLADEDGHRREAGAAPVRPATEPGEAGPIEGPLR